MFDTLAENIQSIINTTRSKNKLDEEAINDALREVRRAFLEADVNLRVVKAFISNIREKALGEDVLKSLTPGQQLVKIVYDELVQLLGGSAKEISYTGKPNIIMMLGLQGSGKTTASAKLALKIRKDNRNPLLVACDIYRPAAIKQLQTLGKQINVPVFSLADVHDVKEIVIKAKDYAYEHGHNTLILDTAGRLQIDTPMMAELLILDKSFDPAEKLLVIDSMTGQEAVSVAEAFNAQIGITGILLTKLDGDARGGAALSVTYATGQSIKLTSSGEKIEALETFYPDRIGQRILGMGDVLSLIERAQENFDLDQAKALEAKVRSKDFSLEDFVNIQKQMKMIGSFEQILNMLPIPGLNKDKKEELAFAGEQQMKKITAMINSMTKEERKNPAILNINRKKRIASGSGTPVEELSRFLKEFENMKKMMKKMSDMQRSFMKKPGKFRLPPGFKDKLPF